MSFSDLISTTVFPKYFKATTTFIYHIFSDHSHSVWEALREAFDMEEPLKKDT